MSIKQIRYNIDNIDKENANYNIIYGEKSNGKSYQVKHKKAVKKYLETGKRFILLRRWAEDMTGAWIEQYFADVDVETLTNNKYQKIIKYRNELFFASITEDFKVKRGEKIGYGIPLSLEQRFSSASFLDVEDIIYEEFMSRGSYLPNEPDKLMTFYSTVDRKRGTTKLWLVGNTVSKICPYIESWGLTNILKTQKQGEIKTLTIQNKENDIKIAVEYCKSSGGKTMSIGTVSSMIDFGGWQVDVQPHLPKSYKKYSVCFRCGFQFKGFKFLGEYLLDKEDSSKTPIWFIKPFQGNFKENIIVVSDEIKVSPYWVRDINNIPFKNEKILQIFKKFNESNIFYSDDNCGTDFKQAIDFNIKK